MNGEGLHKSNKSLDKSYQTYVEKPETKKTGDCQKVDGRGWEDTKKQASSSAQLYVDNVSGVHCTKYYDCV